MSQTFCDVDFSDESADADPVEFHDTTTPTARKDYVCDECREPICKGDKYQKTAFKFEGKLGVDRLCASCAEAKAEFEYHMYGGDFWAHMREQWDNGANVQGCINRLTTMRAKDLMHRQWLKWKGL
jgi:hypothetical protein